MNALKSIWPSRPRPALLARFVRSSRHVEAEPCRNCGTVYFGNYCNECGQEAYTGAPTTLGFIYEFLTRNLFERGKVHRTMWHLVRHPGGLTVDFLEGRRQRFIRPVRLYFILSVMYFLLLSFQNSNVRKYFSEPAPAVAAAPAAAAAAAAAPAPAAAVAPAAKQATVVRQPKIVLGEVTIDPNAGQQVEGGDRPTETSFFDIPFAKEWEKYPAWQTFKKRDKEFTELSSEQREEAMFRIVTDQAPKAMFFLVPVFALFLKGLFVLRRIPYGAHLLFSFHFHSYVFFMLMLMQLPVHELFKVMAGFSMPLYLVAAMRTTYQTGWFGALLRSFMVGVLYMIVIAFTFVAVLMMGFLL